MPQDKFSALWVSHSSVSDFLNCPRAYYLKNIYKDPETNNKVQIVTPALSLGTAVHEVVEALSALPTSDRFKESLMAKFEQVWKKYSGKIGGFLDPEVEEEYKNIGRKMISVLVANPGPLANLSVKLKAELPYYWLSDPENIILCGKIDWLEYLPETNSVHLIDFKTSKKQEADGSLQLPIYHLLVRNTQHRAVEKASYWYLRLAEGIVEKKLPDLESAHEQILAVAKKIKTAKKLGVLNCPKGSEGCFHCKPLESVVRKEAVFVGKGGYNRDIYVLQSQPSELSDDSSIL